MLTKVLQSTHMATALLQVGLAAVKLLLDGGADYAMKSVEHALGNVSERFWTPVKDFPIVCCGSIAELHVDERGALTLAAAKAAKPESLLAEQQRGEEQSAHPR